MPVPTTPALDVGILLYDEIVGAPTRVALVRRPDQPGYALPGGLVEPGEGFEGAFRRHLAEWTAAGAGAVANRGQTLPQSEPRPGSPERVAATVPPVSPEFVACIESGGRPGVHELTMVFAVPWTPSDGAPPVRGAVLEPVPVHDLRAVSVRPASLEPVITRWVDETWPFWSGVPVSSPDPRWGGLRQSVAVLRAQLASRKDDLRGTRFRDASVAMCALVAAADGRIDQAERDQMLEFVTTDEILAVYPPEELERLFDAHVDRLRDNQAAGRETALQEIAKVRGRPLEARSVVQLGAVIGRADGQYDATERQAVSDAVDVLGLDGSALAVQAAIS
ncbi:MAG: TerB family tellurite resistance protein [Frankia sp.]